MTLMYTAWEVADWRCPRRSNCRRPDFKEPERRAVTRVLLAVPERRALTRVLLARDGPSRSVLVPCAARHRNIDYPSSAWSTARLDRAIVVAATRGHLFHNDSGPTVRERAVGKERPALAAARFTGPGPRGCVAEGCARSARPCFEAAGPRPLHRTTCSMSSAPHSEAEELSSPDSLLRSDLLSYRPLVRSPLALIAGLDWASGER